MAYWKYFSSGGGSNSDAYQWALAMRNMPNYTSVNSLSTLSFDRNNTTVNGTHPTANMYTSVNANYSSGNSEWGEASFAKHHYAKGQTSFPDNAKRVVYARQHYGDGMGFTVTDSAGTNWGHSNSTDHTWFPTNTSGHARIATGQAMNWNRGHAIINDTTYLQKVIQSGGQNGSSGTFMLCDLEYNSAIDNHAANGSALHSPQVAFWYFSYNTLDRDPGTNPVTNAGNTTKAPEAHGFSWLQFRQPDGTYANGNRSDGLNLSGNSFVNANYQYSGHSGNSTNGGSNNAIMWPHMRSTVNLSSDANGTIYPLLPVYLQPRTTSDEAGNNMNPRWGKLMNVYRTADNLEDGDVITVGSTRYIVLRLHCTGHISQVGQATQRACYAFPENNVAF